MPSVPSADLIRDFGRYSDIARREPVTISARGRDALVLMSTEEYERLKRRDREAVRLSDMDGDFLKALEKSEMDPRHAHLDELVADWKP